MLHTGLAFVSVSLATALGRSTNHVIGDIALSFSCSLMFYTESIDLAAVSRCSALQCHARLPAAVKKEEADTQEHCETTVVGSIEIAERDRMGSVVLHKHRCHRALLHMKQRMVREGYIARARFG